MSNAFAQPYDEFEDDLDLDLGPPPGGAEPERQAKDRSSSESSSQLGHAGSALPA